MVLCRSQPALQAPAGTSRENGRNGQECLLITLCYCVEQSAIQIAVPGGFLGRVRAVPAWLCAIVRSLYERARLLVCRCFLGGVTQLGGLQAACVPEGERFERQLCSVRSLLRVWGPQWVCSSIQRCVGE